LLQLAVPLLLLRGGQQELNFLWALVLALPGTLLNTYLLERYARNRGLPQGWALCSLLGPPGLLLVVRCRSPTSREPDRSRPPTTSPRHGADIISSLLLTALAAAGFIWAAWAWVGLGGGRDPLDAAQRRQNERRTYVQLKRIAAAQNRYRQHDWDGDGRKTYAEFFIHLWRSVRVDGTPVPVNLIPRELGFAMAPSFARDGYFYRDLHTAGALAALTHTASPPRPTHLDPAEQWAVAALPAAPGSTGQLAFVADSSGAIWTLHQSDSSAASGPPAKSCRIKVRSLQHLKKIQQSMSHGACP
jgi:hypothetical protein